MCLKNKSVAEKRVWHRCRILTYIRHTDSTLTISSNFPKLLQSNNLPTTILPTIYQQSLLNQSLHKTIFMTRITNRKFWLLNLNLIQPCFVWGWKIWEFHEKRLILSYYMTHYDLRCHELTFFKYNANKRYVFQGHKSTFDSIYYQLGISSF